MQINQGKYGTLGKSKENYLKAILITNEQYGASSALLHNGSTILTGVKSTTHLLKEE